METLTSVLGWCTLINWLILLWWFVALRFFRGWVFALHTRWFDIDTRRFDEIHYTAMAQYKVAIFLLNLAPYLALRIVEG